MTFKFNSASFMQHFAWVPLRLFGRIFCRMKIHGLDHVRAQHGNVIFASNHSSELDPLMIVAALPFFSNLLPISYVARSKDFYATLPRGFLYGGKFFDLMGAYPAYTGQKDYEKALPHHLKAIRQGWSVAIFPVGKKHRLEETDKARGGVGYMSYKTGLPVIPIRIDGLGGHTVKDYLWRRCTLTITFGEPVYAADLFDGKVKTDKTPNHEQCEHAAVRLMRRIRDL